LLRQRTLQLAFEKMSPERRTRRTPDRPAAGGPAAVCSPTPETIPVIVEAITITSGGATYRTERTSLLARRVLPETAELDQQEQNIAVRVLELLTALDPKKRLRKAPPITVFNLYYLQGRQPTEIAEICDCDRTVVFDRLAAIRAKLPWTPQQLREMSSQFEAMEDALTDSRARNIHRMSAALGDDGGDDD
jgi:hypothetical protein